MIFIDPESLENLIAFSIKFKNTQKNSLIYDLTVQGCQWMPIGMIEKRLKKDLSENLIAVDKQAKLSIKSL